MTHRRFWRSLLWLAALGLFAWALSRVSLADAWASVRKLDARLFEYWLLAFFLGVTLSAFELIIGLAAVRIAYLLLFPVGLGVLEAGQVAAVRALGFPAALRISLSLVIRFRDVVFTSFGLWLGMRMLMKR